MIIDDKKIADLAHLSRLEFNEEDKEAIKADLGRIIVFCDKLREVNTEGVEPLIYLNNEQNILREDLAEVGMTKNDALKNAPSADSDYFKVPTVLKK